MWLQLLQIDEEGRQQREAPVGWVAAHRNAAVQERIPSSQSPRRLRRKEKYELQSSDLDNALKHLAAAQSIISETVGHVM